MYQSLARGGLYHLTHAGERYTGHYLQQQENDIYLAEKQQYPNPQKIQNIKKYSQVARKPSEQHCWPPKRKLLNY